MVPISRLIDIVANLAAHNPELTIYAGEPWTCESPAILATEPDQGGLPPEARSLGAEYFIEVFVATELLERWMASAARTTTAQGQCEQLIHYAVCDA